MACSVSRWTLGLPASAAKPPNNCWQCWETLQCTRVGWRSRREVRRGERTLRGEFGSTEPHAEWLVMASVQFTQWALFLSYHINYASDNRQLLLDIRMSSGQMAATAVARRNGPWRFDLPMSRVNRRFPTHVSSCRHPAHVPRSPTCASKGGKASQRYVAQCP